MINIYDWFWFRKRKLFNNNIIIGFFKIFSINFCKQGLELTIAKPSYKRILFWWRKIDIIFSPFKIVIYKPEGIYYMIPKQNWYWK